VSHVDPPIQRPIEPIDRWTDLAERALAPVIARVCGDVYRLELTWPSIDGIVDAQALAEFRECAPPTAAALTALLADPRYRHVVKRVVEATRCVPEPLVRPMLIAAASTLNPSANQEFVLPCIEIAGRRLVVTTLVEIAMTGSDWLKAGATNALYWAWMPGEGVGWSFTIETLDDGTWPSSLLTEPVEDVRMAFEDWALREFIDNVDVDVRRSVIRHIVAAGRRDPVLFARAVANARSSADTYIQQRIALELGESRLIPCLQRTCERT
jgi:hypothetical protein